MTQHCIEKKDIFSELLKQTPLKQPSSDFTEKVMNQIKHTEDELHVSFYQKPFFLSVVSILFAFLFLLLYRVNFSFSFFLESVKKDIQYAIEYLSSLHLASHQTIMQPSFIILFIVIGSIFVIDLIIEHIRKKHKMHKITSCE